MKLLKELPSVKGEPGTRPTSVHIHCICVRLKAAVTEGINRAYTATLEGVPLCYTLSNH